MGKERHLAVQAKLACVLALRGAIRAAGVACSAFGEGFAVPIDEASEYRPDALAVYGRTIGPDETDIPDPIIVVEVLTKERPWLGLGKVIGYMRVPSIQHVLAVDPWHHTVQDFRRGPEGAILPATHTEGPLWLDPPGLALTVAELMAPMA